MNSSTAITGSGTVEGLDDAFIRLSLLLPELGLGRELSQFRARAANVLTNDVMEALVRLGNTSAADGCIRRFAAIEADVSNGQAKGLGRVSSYGFPRLGGAIYGKLPPGSEAAAVLTAAVERTIHAGYLAVLTTEKGASAPLVLDTPNLLWENFIPVSYGVPPHLGDIALNTCAFDTFWLAILERCGLGKDAKQWRKGKATSIGQSIGGLCTVGVALSLAERGMAKP